MKKKPQNETTENLLIKKKSEELANYVKANDIEKVKQLLKEKININIKSKNNDGNTPLIIACQDANIEMVKLLIEAGANVNTKNTRRESPLSVICGIFEGDQKKIAEITRLLLKNGADPNKYSKKDTDGPIHTASVYGYLEAVKLLIQYKADVNRHGEYGRTPLHYVAYSSSVEITKLLIEAGADLNALNEGGDNPLFELITQENSNPKIAKILIDAGIDIHYVHESSGTALHWAAFCGKMEIVKLLVEHGLDINKIYSSDSPLTNAMSQHHVSIVKYLYKKGATVPNEGIISYYDSILDWAINNGEREFAKSIINDLIHSNQKASEKALIEAVKLADMEIIFLLLDNNLVTNLDEALRKAAYYGHLDVVKVLLERGANISAKDYNGSTPLLHAAWSGYTDIVKYLLENGANINEKNNYNWNALMQACVEGHYETAKLLLELGSPTDEIDKEQGATALTLAKHSKNQKLIDLLISYGAKERHIRKRGDKEAYLSIFECDICKYLPHKKDFGNISLKNLVSIYKKEGHPDRYTDEIKKILKCPNCGTYYQYYDFIDTEDAFVGGPDVSTNFQRYNLLRIMKILKTLKKSEELTEIKKLYPKIITDFEKRVTNNQDIPDNFVDYLVENLTDYYIEKNDWDSLQKNLFLNKNKEIAFMAMHDAILIYGERGYKSLFPWFTDYRDIMPKIKSKFKTMLKEYSAEFKKCLEQIKDSKSEAMYKNLINSAKYYKIFKRNKNR